MPLWIIEYSARPLGFFLVIPEHWAGNYSDELALKRLSCWRWLFWALKKMCSKELGKQSSTLDLSDRLLKTTKLDYKRSCLRLTHRKFKSNKLNQDANDRPSNNGDWFLLISAVSALANNPYPNAADQWLYLNEITQMYRQSGCWYWLLRPIHWLPT